MSNYPVDFWNERYSSDEYVYGESPNLFFKEEIDKISLPGKLLLPGEGEGRNAVYAAKLGWQVDAFDQSVNAQRKALSLAKKNEVNINYSVVDLNKFVPLKNYYNAVAIIFVHFSSEYRIAFHNKIINSLKPSGIIILELFSKEQFGKTSGGPQDLKMLYSIDEIRKDFSCLKAIFLKEETIDVNEGEKHKGEARVIRFVGEKT